jgi:hypothetical protein
MQKLNNKINCGSGDSIVGYIYNELPSADRLAFEDHLLDCTACTDEFAAIADSRYAVYEWQKLEFEPMPTPRFAIPYAETKVSWFDSIKSVFATGPRLATAGAVGLLIVAVGFAAIFMSSGPTEVVSIGDVEVTDTFPKPAAPTAGNTAVEVSALTEPDVTEKQGEVKPEYVPVTKRAPKVEQKRKSSTVRRNARLQNIGNETQAKAPRLNDFEDLSDDSLRLSDLVADIDTRD